MRQQQVDLLTAARTMNSLIKGSRNPRETLRPRHSRRYDDKV